MDQNIFAKHSRYRSMIDEKENKVKERYGKEKHKSRGCNKGEGEHHKLLMIRPRSEAQ